MENTPYRTRWRKQVETLFGLCLMCLYECPDSDTAYTNLYEHPLIENKDIKDIEDLMKKQLLIIPQSKNRKICLQCSEKITTSGMIVSCCKKSIKIYFNDYKLKKYYKYYPSKRIIPKKQASSNYTTTNKTSNVCQIDTKAAEENNYASTSQPREEEYKTNSSSLDKIILSINLKDKNAPVIVNPKKTAKRKRKSSALKKQTKKLKTANTIQKETISSQSLSVQGSSSIQLNVPFVDRNIHIEQNHKNKHDIITTVNMNNDMLSSKNVMKCYATSNNVNENCVSQPAVSCSFSTINTVTLHYLTSKSNEITIINNPLVSEENIIDQCEEQVGNNNNATKMNGKNEENKIDQSKQKVGTEKTVFNNNKNLKNNEILKNIVKEDIISPTHLAINSTAQATNLPELEVENIVGNKVIESDITLPLKLNPIKIVSKKVCKCTEITPSNKIQVSAKEQLLTDKIDEAECLPVLNQKNIKKHPFVNVSTFTDNNNEKKTEKNKQKNQKDIVIQMVNYSNEQKENEQLLSNNANKAKPSFSLECLPVSNQENTEDESNEEEIEENVPEEQTAHEHLLTNVIDEPEPSSSLECLLVSNQENIEDRFVNFATFADKSNKKKIKEDVQKKQTIEEPITTTQNQNDIVIQMIKYSNEQKEKEQLSTNKINEVEPSSSLKSLPISNQENLFVNLSTFIDRSNGRKTKDKQKKQKQIILTTQNQPDIVIQMNNSSYEQNKINEAELSSSLELSNLDESELEQDKQTKDITEETIITTHNQTINESNKQKETFDDLIKETNDKQSMIKITAKNKEGSNTIYEESLTSITENITSIYLNDTSSQIIEEQKTEKKTENSNNLMDTAQTIKTIDENIELFTKPIIDKKEIVDMLFDAKENIQNNLNNTETVQNTTLTDTSNNILTISDDDEETTNDQKQKIESCSVVLSNKRQEDLPYLQSIIENLIKKNAQIEQPLSKTCLFDKIKVILTRLNYCTEDIENVFNLLYPLYHTTVNEIKIDNSIIVVDLTNDDSLPSQSINEETSCTLINNMSIDPSILVDLTVDEESFPTQLRVLEGNDYNCNLKNIFYEINQIPIKKINTQTSLSTMILEIINYKKKGEYFQCEVCSLSFSKAVYVKTHTLFMHPKSDQCGLCFKKLEEQFEIDLHRKVLIPCIYCGELFTLHSYEVHIINHEEVFKCQHCFYQCKDVEEYKKHSLDHSGEFVCVICNKNFYSKILLVYHLGSEHELDELAVLRFQNIRRRSRINNLLPKTPQA